MANHDFTEAQVLAENLQRISTAMVDLFKNTKKGQWEGRTRRLYLAMRAEMRVSLGKLNLQMSEEHKCDENT